jgi:hypothetical protein
MRFISPRSFEQLVSPIIPDLRELLVEYTTNRERFPFYDVLPPGLRRQYLDYFTPVAWSDFQVIPGVPVGSDDLGVIARIPNSVGVYSCFHSDERTRISDTFFILDGVNGHRTRVVDLTTGRSADLVEGLLILQLHPHVE